MVRSIDTKNVTTVVGGAIGAGVGAILWGPAGAVIGAALATLALREFAQRS